MGFHSLVPEVVSSFLEVGLIPRFIFPIAYQHAQAMRRGTRTNDLKVEMDEVVPFIYLLGHVLRF